MPELPEVETVRRDLHEHLVGRTIESVCLHRDDILLQTSADALAEALRGAKVTSVDRRGKNLIIQLDRGPAVLINLGMTGQLFIADAEAKLADHTHLVAQLSDGNRLVFRDIRRFGHVELCADGQAGESCTLRKVGIDAMSEDFTAEALAEILRGRNAIIKSALLDQSRVAGLGNIYVCEALYRAGVSPLARCGQLTPEAIRRLHRAIRQVLRESIAAEGTTISDYVTGTGVPGGFQKRLRVYGREGERCRKRGCGRRIERIVQSNRSTFYCPGCQPDPAPGNNGVNAH